MGSSQSLSDRARRILTALVREYIETGTAVSSQVLADQAGLGVSSATIRNVLAQLEADGYLLQPHTSAGRVPTDKAYRVFVDLLLEAGRRARAPLSVEQALQEAARAPLVSDLLAAMAHEVTRATQHVGFSLSESPAPILQHIEFVPLGGTRVLVVVVARSGEVTQKVVDAGSPVRPSDLSQASAYLNAEFAGLPLPDIRAAVVARLLEEQTLYSELLGRALRLANSTLEDFPLTQEFHVEGVASLFDVGGPAEGPLPVVTLRALVEMMEEKERMLHLLTEYIDGPGLTVIIGAEHLTPDLRPFSLVAATSHNGGALRTVGVIGPTRMHYSRAIGVVDAAARTMTQALRHGQ